MVNNCLFLDNAATTVASFRAFGGAISSSLGKLTVVDSIFKNNRAIQVDTTSGDGGGGAIYAFGGTGVDVLVLSSLFESNEASNVGGAALLGNVGWYNNKELLSGNDSGEDCGGAKVVTGDCFNVTDNFSI